MTNMAEEEDMDNIRFKAESPSLASDSKSEAELMAGLIENWLSNSVSKIFLKFITKRNKKERRAEKILGSYAGLE
jgi:hypothetical protein